MPPADTAAEIASLLLEPTADPESCDQLVALLDEGQHEAGAKGAAKLAARFRSLENRDEARRLRRVSRLFAKLERSTPSASKV